MDIFIIFDVCKFLELFVRVLKIKIRNNFIFNYVYCCININLFTEYIPIFLFPVPHSAYIVDINLSLEYHVTQLKCHILQHISRPTPKIPLCLNKILNITLYYKIKKVIKFTKQIYKYRYLQKLHVSYFPVYTHFLLFLETFLEEQYIHFKFC